MIDDKNVIKIEVRGSEKPYSAYGRYYMRSADENDISIKVVTFAGKDKTNLIKRNEYGGTCLVTAIDKVLDYVESMNETMVTMGNHRRTEEKLFDMASFKEAWQNACIHTKWDKGNPPAVYIFSDRIEIISTGGLPVDLNREEFYKGISKPVNAKLQKLFGQLGYVEQTDHGIPLIISNYGKQAFDIMENYVNVTIPFNFEKRNSDGMGVDNEISINEAEQRVIDFISQNSSITIKELVAASRYSDGYIRKILASLKEKKVIARQGGNKSGKWVVLR